MKDNDNIAPLFVLILGFLLGMTLVSLVSCEEQKPQKETPKEITDITEFTYQGCEYIRVGVSTRSWGSHKGNCKNPIHKK